MFSFFPCFYCLSYLIIKKHFLPPQRRGRGRESPFEFEGCMKYFPLCRCTLNKSEQKRHYPLLTSCTHAMRSPCLRHLTDELTVADVFVWSGKYAAYSPSKERPFSQCTRLNPSRMTSPWHKNNQKCPRVENPH